MRSYATPPVSRTLISYFYFSLSIVPYVRQTRLHIRTGDSTNWNNGVDPDFQLNLNQWYHIAIIVSSNRVQVRTERHSVFFS